MGGNVSRSSRSSFGAMRSRRSRSDDEEASLMDVVAQVMRAVDAHQPTPPPPPPNRLPMTFMTPALFTCQVPSSPLKLRNERMQIQKLESMLISIDEEDFIRKKRIPIMIMWTHGGITVAVEGSCDNWTKKELLEKAGDDFVMVKLLHSGVYHYRFIVNGRWAHDEQLPWAKDDDTGRVCNILDVQGYVPEAIESRSVLEAPPSPESTYNNILDIIFYAKEPPPLPPILHSTILNCWQPTACKPLPRPPHAILDHLYIQETRDNPPVLAIGSTQRFRWKYVTVELYRPSREPY